MKPQVLGVALVVVLCGSGAAADENDCVPVASGTRLEAWGWRLQVCAATPDGMRRVVLGRQGRERVELATLWVSASAGEPEVFSVAKAARARDGRRGALELEAVVSTRGKSGDCAGGGTVLQEVHTQWSCGEEGDAGVGCVARALPGVVDVTCVEPSAEQDAGPLSAGLPLGSTWVERLRVLGEQGLFQSTLRKTVVALDGGTRALEVRPLASRSPLVDGLPGPSMEGVRLSLELDGGQGAGTAETIVAALLPSAAGAVIKPLGPRRHALGPAHAYSVCGGSFDTSASMGGVSEQWSTDVRGEVVILDGTGLAVRVHLAGRRDYEASSLDWVHCDEVCVNGVGPRISIVSQRSSTPLAVDLTVESKR
jgi:hypothetical protein